MSRAISTIATPRTWARQTAQPEELPLLHLLAAHSADGRWCAEHEGRRPLQPIGRRAARSRDSPLVHDLPLGSPTSTGGARRLAKPRSREVLRGLCRSPGRAPWGSDHHVGAVQHALGHRLHGLRSRRVPTLPHEFSRFSEGSPHACVGAGRSVPRHQSGVFQGHRGQRVRDGPRLSEDRLRGRSSGSRALPRHEQCVLPRSRDERSLPEGVCRGTPLRDHGVRGRILTPAFGPRCRQKGH